VLLIMAMTVTSRSKVNMVMKSAQVLLRSSPNSRHV